MRILIAEHNENTLTQICTLLSQNGHEALPCTSAFQALAIATRKIPELIMLDMNLADFDGATTCKLLKINPQTANIPLLVTSSAPERVDSAFLEKFSILAIISKPINSTELLYKIRHIVDEVNHAKQ